MSHQTNKLVLAVVLALIFALLLGGVSFTLFPLQASTKQHVQVESFLPAGGVGTQPILGYSAISNASFGNNSAYAGGIAQFYFTYQLPEIAIEKDGSINSTTAPILRNGNTYTLTGDIVNQTIVVNCDNIVIDGAGHTLEGFFNGTNVFAAEAISLQNVQNVTIKNFNIDCFWQSIQAQDSSNLLIEENNFTSCPSIPTTYDSPIAANLDSCNDSVIAHNFSEETFDVWGSSTNNTIVGNTISNVSEGIEVSTNTTVIGNTIYNVADGIYIYQGSYDTITGNKLTNVSYSIGVDGNSSVISNNIIVNGSSGINIQGACNIITGNTLANVYANIGLGGDPSVISNIISNNTIVNGVDGIEIYQSSYSYGSAYTKFVSGIYVAGNSTIFGNSIDNMTDVGLSFSGQNGTIYENTIENSKYGVWLEPGNVSEGTVFYHNNFINNTQDVKFDPTTAPVQWDYGKEGNYWSNYNGTDHNGDGIGDMPYNLGGNNTDLYPLMQPYFMQSSITVYSTGRLLFIAALIVAGIGVVVLLCLSFKSKFDDKRD